MSTSYCDIHRYPTEPDRLFDLCGQVLLSLGWEYRCDRQGRLIASIPGTSAGLQYTFTVRVYGIGAVSAQCDNNFQSFDPANRRHVDLFFNTLGQFILKSAKAVQEEPRPADAIS